MDVTRRPSPNFDERALPVSMIVLHYTGMPDAEGALNRMTSPESRVSAHYMVTEEGEIIQLVDEEKRAWHAGKSYWRGITDVNSASVGIEIVNPGHEFGYRNFPDEQIASVIPLVADIKERHGIGRGNIVGHSDVAPSRKEDPGELFPWPARNADGRRWARVRVWRDGYSECTRCRHWRCSHRRYHATATCRRARRAFPRRPAG